MLTELEVSEREENAFDLSSLGENLEGYTLHFSNEGCFIYSEEFTLNVPLTCEDISTLGERHQDDVVMKDEDSNVVLLIRSEQIVIINELLKENKLSQWQIEPI